MRYASLSVLLILVFMLAGHTMVSQPSNSRGSDKQMIKAMWVVRFSMTSPESVKRVVEIAHKFDYDAIFVQVRGRGDAFYNSHFEPRAQDLDKQPESFDPLQLVITEAHKYGIQVHAWLNTHYVWGLPTLPRDPNHIVNAHPDWLMKDKNGVTHMTGSERVEGAYSCPSNAHVRARVVDCFADVVRNYDVDGVHFDFVRYPNEDYCYCEGCSDRFKSWLTKSKPDVDMKSSKDLLQLTATYSDEWTKWRQDQITAVVRDVRRRVKAIKPRVLISAAVFPDAEDAKNHRFQDWGLWMKRGYLDILCPMAYSTDTAKVQAQTADALAKSNGRSVWIGLGAWRITPDSTLEKINAVSASKTKGYILFSYDGVTKDGTSEEYLLELHKDNK